MANHRRSGHHRRVERRGCRLTDGAKVTDAIARRRMSGRHDELARRADTTRTSISTSRRGNDAFVRSMRRVGEHARRPRARAVPPSGPTRCVELMIGDDAAHGLDARSGDGGISRALGASFGARLARRHSAEAGDERVGLGRRSSRCRRCSSRPRAPRAMIVVRERVGQLRDYRAARRCSADGNDRRKRLVQPLATSVRPTAP